MQIIKGNKDIVFTDAIARVEDESDEYMSRVKVFFNNGEFLSIVRGSWSYGGESGLFEIMPSDRAFFDEGDSGDVVLGYLTVERVNYYINKIGSINT